MISQDKRLIKKKRGEDKDEQEGRPTFMITTAAAVRELCMVVPTSKARAKHTVSSTTFSKIQITTHNDDRNGDNRSDVDGGASDG